MVDNSRVCCLLTRTHWKMNRRQVAEMAPKSRSPSSEQSTVSVWDHLMTFYETCASYATRILPRDRSDAAKTVTVLLVTGIGVAYYLRSSGRLLLWEPTKKFATTEEFLARYPGQTKREKWYQAIKQATKRAYQTNTLKPLTTVPHMKWDGAIPFAIARANLSSWTTKKRQQSEGSTERIDHLGNPDAPLVVWENFLKDYTILLNKFPVVDHHALVVTNEFVPQQTFPTKKDFQAFWKCVDEVDAVGFFNCGEESGASQPRKHFQFVPMEAVKSKMPFYTGTQTRLESLPVSVAIAGERRTQTPMSPPGQTFKLPDFKFRHAICMVGKDILEMPSSRAAERLYAWYRKMLNEVGMKGPSEGTKSQPSEPHNLILTREWIILVPRSQTSCYGVESNALGYSGMLLAKDDESWETVHNVGPLRILKECGKE